MALVCLAPNRLTIPRSNAIIGSVIPIIEGLNILFFLALFLFTVADLQLNGLVQSTAIILASTAHIHYEEGGFLNAF